MNDKNGVQRLTRADERQRHAQDDETLFCRLAEEADSTESGDKNVGPACRKQTCNNAQRRR